MNIQLVEAIFDYYNHFNVKPRHEQAFLNILNIMHEFERAFQHETGTSIAGHMQQAWRRYMQLHMHRVGQFARGWMRDKLKSMRDVWSVLPSIALAVASMLARLIYLLTLPTSL